MKGRTRQNQQINWAWVLRRFWRQLQQAGLSLIALAILAILILLAIKLGYTLFTFYGMWLLLIWAVSATLYYFGTTKRNISLIALQHLFVLIVLVYPFI